MKSLSIKTKLAILVIIPLVAALIVTVLGLFYVNKISSNLTQSLYNEGFQSISLVLNADRDLYQALDSVNGLLMENSKGVLDPASKEEFVAGYEENAVQTSDRVKEAVDLLSENKEFWSEIKDDSGANVFDHYASFEENFAKWEEMSASIT
ncbi:MAG: methyl-accepting chemotaxis protein, partial [Clostridia bacterium]|nr:methyl-accepting chemotaxis protein [Clostridia bacterium]